MVMRVETAENLQRTEVRAFDSPTMLASRLCRLEPGLTRVVLNTTSTGVFVNPILLEDEKEARYVGIRIGDEINCLMSRRGSSKL